jgi:hypothetical protein
VEQRAHHLRLARQLKTVDPRHSYVGNQKVDVVHGQGANCFETIHRREDFVIFISQSIDNDLAKLGIVAEKLSAIAMALGVTVDYLLGADEQTLDTAEDTAFFRQYSRMSEETRRQIR